MEDVLHLAEDLRGGGPQEPTAKSNEIGFVINDAIAPTVLQGVVSFPIGKAKNQFDGDDNDAACPALSVHVRGHGIN